MKVVAMGLGVIVLALVAGGVVLAARGSGNDVANVTSTQVIAKPAPTNPGNASAPAHASQDSTKVPKSAAPKCATEEEQSAAGDNNDRSGDDGPDAAGSSNDCSADAAGNDPTGADQPGTGEEGGDPTGDDGRRGDR